MISPGGTKKLLFCVDMSSLAQALSKYYLKSAYPRPSLLPCTIRISQTHNTKSTHTNQPTTPINHNTNQPHHQSTNSVYPPKCLPATATPPHGRTVSPPHRRWRRSIPAVELLETGGWVTNSTHPRSGLLPLLGLLPPLPGEDNPPHPPHPNEASVRHLPTPPAPPPPPPTPP